MDLPEFCSEAPRGLQRKSTHAIEDDISKRASTALQPSDTMCAFIHGCDGRWIRAARLPHMQLANEETVTRMQRYLRQPLSATAGIVGGLTLDVSGSITIDPYGDCFLSKYKAKGGKHYERYRTVPVTRWSEMEEEASPDTSLRLR